MFNIYVNSKKDSIVKTCELVQYADETSIFVRGKKFDDVIQFLETKTGNLVEFLIVIDSTSIIKNRIYRFLPENIEQSDKRSSIENK